MARRRKRAQSDERERAVARLIGEVRRAAVDQSVVDVSGHFAGYFDELGITITVKPGTSDAELTAVKEKVAPQILQARVPFKWILMF